MQYYIHVFFLLPDFQWIEGDHCEIVVQVGNNLKNNKSSLCSRLRFSDSQGGKSSTI